MCGIAEYFSFNDLIKMRSINKYYYLWTIKEIKIRMTNSNIKLILRSANSLCLYHGRCDYTGKILNYQYIGTNYVLSFQTDLADPSISIVIYSFDRIICIGCSDIYDYWDIHCEHKIFDAYHGRKNLSDNFGEKLQHDRKFIIDKNYKLYVSTWNGYDLKPPLYFICKLSEKMISQVNAVKLVITN